MVTDAIFLGVGVVGMAWTKGILQCVVVLGVLGGVGNQNGDGCAGGTALKDTAKNLTGVSLLAGGDGGVELSIMVAGPPSVQLLLDDCLV